MQNNDQQPKKTKARFTPAERAQIRQLLYYLAAIVVFVILAGLVMGVLLNHSN